MSTGPLEPYGNADNFNSDRPYSLLKETDPPLAPPNVNVDDNIKEASQHMSPIWFRNIGKNKGPWDYKQLGREFENFGNFNYGATGAAMGFSEETLLRMGGWAQKGAGTSDPKFGSNAGFLPSFLGLGGTPPFGDDPADQAWISRGIKYYKENYK